jgi:ubiquinone/menaquinone biosynthesis C-methylase UbiE
MICESSKGQEDWGFLLLYAKNASLNLIFLGIGLVFMGESAMQRKFKRKRVRIPPFVRHFLFFILDIVKRVKNPGGLIPPRSLMFRPSPYFMEFGEEIKNRLIDDCGLQPDHRILDIGSGEGRVAIPLTGYLSKTGEYWGLEIRKKSVEWCQKKITSRYENFHFQHWDIFNEQYNPKGSLNAEDFSLRFDDGSFDIVFLISVFSHLRPGEVKNYLGEISRILKVGGKCLFTIFLLSEEFKNFASPGITDLDFKYVNEDLSVSDKKEYGFTTAFREGVIFDILEQYPLAIVQRKHPGTWIRRSHFLTAQELFVVKRT